jgi:hypothetical protein
MKPRQIFDAQMAELNGVDSAKGKTNNEASRAFNGAYIPSNSGRSIFTPYNRFPLKNYNTKIFPITPSEATQTSTPASTNEILQAPPTILQLIQPPTKKEDKPKEEEKFNCCIIC